MEEPTAGKSPTHWKMPDGPPWWLNWLAAALLIAVFRRNPAQLVELVTAVGWLIFVRWLWRLQIDCPEQVKAVFEMLGKGLYWKHKDDVLRLGASLDDLEEERRRMTGDEEQSVDQVNDRG